MEELKLLLWNIFEQMEDIPAYEKDYRNGMQRTVGACRK